MKKLSGKKVPYKIVERRPGDVASCYADPTKAKEELGWVAEKGIEEMCRMLGDGRRRIRMGMIKRFLSNGKGLKFI